MSCKRKSVAVRLHEKLLRCGYLVDKPKRTMAGHWQRSSGAWVWVALFNFNLAGKGGDIGSQETMASCLKMTDIELVDELNSYLASYQTKHKII